MFTGLVEDCATVTAVRSEPPGCRLFIRQSSWGRDATIGESIAINGCCLTLVAVEGDDLVFEAGPETLVRTNLGAFAAGSEVNLERSLRVGDRMGGHFVTGHIDGIGKVERRDDSGEWSTFAFRAPAELTKQMARKGSVAVDGVSLTLVDVDRERFTVMIIPHTLEHTTLSKRRVGDTVNIETDLLAKYVQGVE